MKKRALSLLMAVILVVSLLPTAVWAADGTLSGSGTEADPYLIASADDLNAFIAEGVNRPIMFVRFPVSAEA